MKNPIRALIAMALIPLAGSLLGCESRIESVTTPHDFTTANGAILCLEDAYRANDLEAAVKCKDFRIEARIMLGKLDQDFSGDEEILTKTAEVLELAYRNEMQSNGIPDFKGIDSTFTKKVPYEGYDDVVVVTEVCTYPDGGTSSQNILVANTMAGWRVLNPVD